MFCTWRDLVTLWIWPSMSVPHCPLRSGHLFWCTRDEDCLACVMRLRPGQQVSSGLRSPHSRCPSPVGICPSSSSGPAGICWSRWLSQPGLLCCQPLSCDTRVCDQAKSCWFYGSQPKCHLRKVFFGLSVSIRPHFLFSLFTTCNFLQFLLHF